MPMVPSTSLTWHKSLGDCQLTGHELSPPSLSSRLCTWKSGPLLTGEKGWGNAGSQEYHLHFQTVSSTLL